MLKAPLRSDRPLHVRSRQPVERGVGAQAGHKVDAPVIEPRQELTGRESGVDADVGDLAQAGLGTVDHVEDHVQRAVRSADIPGPKAGVQHVAGRRAEGTPPA